VRTDLEIEHFVNCNRGCSPNKEKCDHDRSPHKNMIAVLTIIKKVEHFVRTAKDPNIGYFCEHCDHDRSSNKEDRDHSRNPIKT